MPRKAKRFSDEDQAFLQTQADAIGCDVDTYLCMVVRQMRRGQLPTLAFGQRTNFTTAAVEDTLDRDLRARRQPELTVPAFPSDPAQWGAPAPLPEQNAPAEEFNFHTAEAVQPAQVAHTEPSSSLVDEMARIASGVAQDSFSEQYGTSPAAGSVTALRRSLKGSTAPQLAGPPGSATRIVGVSRGFAPDQQGDGRGNVQRQNMRHMYGR
jgi:hypothetical protein